MFRSFSLQRPHFLSHYLPHRQPSLPQKQDFFFFFMVPFIYRLCFFLALAPFQKSREAKAGKQCHSLNSSKMLTTHPKSSQLAPQSSWDSTFQHQPAPLQIEVGPLQPRNEPDLVKVGRMGYDLGGILISRAHNSNNKIITDIRSI